MISSFPIGGYCKRKGVLYRILSKAATGQHINLMCYETNQAVNVLEATLVSELYRGELTIVPPPGEHDEDGLARYAQEQDFQSKKSKETTERWRKFVAGWKDLGIDSTSDAVLDIASEQVATKHGYSKKDVPSARSLRRWIALAHMTGTYNIQHVRVDYAGRGNTRPRFDFMARRIIWEEIERGVFTTTPSTGKKIQELIDGRLIKLGYSKGPCLASIYRAIGELDPYLVVLCQKGRIEADRLFPSRKHPRANRPLEIVEIDTTQLNCYALSKCRKYILGLPRLTIATDNYSGLILGFNLDLDEESSDSVMKCMRNMIFPKDWIEVYRPDLVSVWPARGKPTNIKCDNGKAYLSSTTAHACFDLNIHIDPCPGYHPEYKGMVERHLGTINGEVQQIQGTSMQSYQFIAKGHYDPGKYAIFTFEEIKRYLVFFIVDKLHNAPYDAGRSRLEIWNEGIRAHPPADPHDVRELDVLLNRFEYVRIGDEGISLHGEKYITDPADPGYKDWQSLCLAGRGMKLRARQNLDDISTLDVEHPAEKRYVSVPCADQEKTRGVSLSELKMINEHVRMQLAEGETAIRQQQAEARMKLEALVVDATHKTAVRNPHVRKFQEGIERRAAKYGVERYLPDLTILKERPHIPAEPPKVASPSADSQPTPDLAEDDFERAMREAGIR